MKGSLHSVLILLAVFCLHLNAQQLPEDSQQLLDKLQEFQQQKNDEVDAEMRKHRLGAIEALKKIEQQETAKGNLQSALKVRAAITSLAKGRTLGKTGSPSPPTAIPGVSGTRTFTNNQGNQITAEVIAQQKGKVIVRRISDGRVFDIPISSLSVDDQIWLADRLNRITANQWRKLTITVPNPRDVVEVIGIDGGVVRERYGAVTYEINLPPGAWVKFYVLNERGSLEQMVKFEGAKHWTVSSDGPRTLLDRDGKGPVAIGITLDHGVSMEQLSELPPGVDWALELSVELQSADQIPMLADFPAPISAIVGDGVRLNAANLRQLAGYNPKAMHLHVLVDDLPALAEFKQLESLRIWLQGLQLFQRPGKNRYTVPTIPFPSIPTLRDIALQVPAAPNDLPDVLAASVPNLRMFDIDVMPTRPPEFAVWTNLGQFRQLESITNGWGITFAVETLAKHPRLQCIVFGPSGIRSDDPGLVHMESNYNLRILANRHGGFPGEVMERWAQNGGLEALHGLQTFRNLDLSLLESLETVSLRRDGRNQDEFDISRVGSLSKLKLLSLHYAKQEEVEEIARLSNRDQLEVVLLANGSFDDITPLTALPNLKRLELVSHRGNMPKLDLGIFPKLEYFRASNLDEITKIEGVASHPALMALSIRNIPNLTGFGEAAPNNRLRYLSLLSCGALTDLDSLGQCTAIKQVFLYDCDGLTEPLAIQASNQIGYFYVSGCAQMASRGSQW